MGDISARPLCEYYIAEYKLSHGGLDSECASSYPGWENSDMCESFLTNCHSLSNEIAKPLCVVPKDILK